MRACELGFGRFGDGVWGWDPTGLSWTAAHGRANLECCMNDMGWAGVLIVGFGTGTRRLALSGDRLTAHIAMRAHRKNVSIDQF